jgi:hypothetical protein
MMITALPETPGVDVDMILRDRRDDQQWASPEQASIIVMMGGERHDDRRGSSRGSWPDVTMTQMDHGDDHSPPS